MISLMAEGARRDALLFPLGIDDGQHLGVVLAGACSFRVQVLAAPGLLGQYEPRSAMRSAILD